MLTPLRRLQGITYWVIEEPDAIHDFINTDIRREWEADARSEGRDPSNDSWLQTLSKLRWQLDITDIDRIKLGSRIMNYVNVQRSYSFAESLAERRKALRQEIETYGAVIWPVILRGEDLELVDGYCRYTALKEMNVSRIYVYSGYLHSPSAR